MKEHFDNSKAEGMNLKKLICSFLIAVLTVGCFTACADRNEEPSALLKKRKRTR